MPVCVNGPLSMTVSVENRVGVLGGECVGFQKYVIYPVRSVIWIFKKLLDFRMMINI